jgi:hypothetical protein
MGYPDGTSSVFVLSAWWRTDEVRGRHVPHGGTLRVLVVLLGSP